MIKLNTGCIYNVSFTSETAPRWFAHVMQLEENDDLAIEYMQQMTGGPLPKVPAPPGMVMAG